MPKRKEPGQYATAPAVPAKKVAGENPVGNVALGSMNSPTVPEKIGVNHGFGPHEHPFRHPHIKGVHGYGHLPKQRQGHFRTSGNPLAHQLGKK